MKKRIQDAKKRIQDVKKRIQDAKKRDLNLSNYDRIYAVVKRIPKGRVATYGQVASLAGLPGHARQVGYALHALPENHRLPWHRVVNAKGEVSPRAYPFAEDMQRAFLEAEGIPFDERNRFPLEEYRWRPRKAL